jgi:hypothetical protein
LSPLSHNLWNYLTTFRNDTVPQEVNFSGFPPTAPPSSQYLDPESSPYDRLKREAEGLFDEVNLLNEMESLEDIDGLTCD